MGKMRNRGSLDPGPPHRELVVVDSGKVAVTVVSPTLALCVVGLLHICVALCALLSSFTYFISFSRL